MCPKLVETNLIDMDTVARITDLESEQISASYTLTHHGLKKGFDTYTRTDVDFMQTTLIGNCNS